MKAMGVRQSAGLLAVALTAAAVACEVDLPTGPDAKVYSRLNDAQYGAPAGPLTVELQVPSRAEAGEAVSLTVRVGNRGAEPLRIAYAGHAPVDIVLVTEDSAVVWERLYGVHIPDAAKYATLGPGEVLVFSYTWDQRDNRGRRVSRGTYRARAVFFGNLEDSMGYIWTEPVPLVIQ